MRAVWIEDRQATLVDDLARPGDPLPSGEALVRVLYSGICSTDHGLIRGMYPFRGVPGHEFVGVVESGGNGLDGQRVVGVISAACGRCATCHAGRAGHCPHRTVLGIQDRNGTFAEYTLLPAVNLHPVPESIPDEHAVFVEPLAAALEILEQVHVKPTDRVLLVGPGKLGQLIARVLQSTPCRLTVAARSPNSVARLPGGVATCRPEDVEPQAFDIVVECTGNREGFGVARGAVRPRGTLVLKSTHGMDTPFDMTMAVVDEITVIGSRCGPFVPAIQLLESGQVDPGNLIDDVFPLSHALAAIERSREPGVFKVLMECGK